MILDGVFHRPVIHKEQDHIPHFAFSVIALYEKPQVLKLIAIALLSSFGFYNANICLILQTHCDIIQMCINPKDQDNSEVAIMAVSYKKLWKLLIDGDLKKKDLEEMAQVSHYTMNKLTHGDNVTTDVLGRICKALGCSLDDIMEFVDE